MTYDVVPSLDWEWFYGTDWGYESHIWRFTPYKEEPIMQDLGRAWGPPDFKTDRYLEGWQVRGLVFGSDKKLYFTMSSGWEKEEHKYLIRLNTETGEREIICSLTFGDHKPRAIASATFDFYGNLYFAEAGNSPTGMYIYRPNYVNKNKKLFSWKDVKLWG